MRALAFALSFAFAFSLAFTFDMASARADGASPYRLWWSYQNDSSSAVEIDHADLSASAFSSPWELARALRRCAPARRPAGLGESFKLREIRIEQLDSDGKVRSATHCVLSLASWRHRLGARVVERLDDELDAHESFVHPRKHPGPAPRPSPDEGRPKDKPR